MIRTPVSIQQHILTATLKIIAEIYCSVFRWSYAQLSLFQKLRYFGNDRAVVQKTKGSGWCVKWHSNDTWTGQLLVYRRTHRARSYHGRTARINLRPSRITYSSPPNCVVWPTKLRMHLRQLAYSVKRSHSPVAPPFSPKLPQTLCEVVSICCGYSGCSKLRTTWKLYIFGVHFICRCMATSDLYTVGQASSDRSTRKAVAVATEHA